MNSGAFSSSSFCEERVEMRASRFMPIERLGWGFLTGERASFLGIRLGGDFVLYSCELMADGVIALVIEDL